MEKHRVIINTEIACHYCRSFDETPEESVNWCRYCDQLMPILRLLHELDMI